MDNEDAWERLYGKHSPSKMVQYSPIRQTAHLSGSEGSLNEEIMKAMIWTLLNTEEFHYHNSSVLVYHNYKDPEHLCLQLKDHRGAIEWNDRLIDYRFLGEGQFGEVYQAIDKLTDERYALKGIKPIEDECDEDDCASSFYEFLSFILLERNIFAELNRSPFFVRMLSAFQSSDKSRFWFVLDYCLCDFHKLLSLYSFYNDPDQLVEDYIESESLEKVSLEMSEILEIDYTNMVFIYLFEMLSALHYLASRHIVHADLKLENILISQNGHLKLSDFGVSFRNQWFDRNSIVMLPQNMSELAEADRKDEEFRKLGSVDYYDPELIIDGLKKDDIDGYEILREMLLESKFFDSIPNMHQNFMSDLFAVGLVTFELLTGGLMFSNTSISQEEEPMFWGIEIIYREETRKMYLEDKIMRFSKSDEILSVLDFLMSIYAPREIRAREFRTEIAIFQQKKRILEHYIDIHKVENIQYYNSRLITKENVMNQIFPESFLYKLNKEFKPRGKRINMTTDMNSRKTKKVFNLHPFNYNLNHN